MVIRANNGFKLMLLVTDKLRNVKGISSHYGKKAQREA